MYCATQQHLFLVSFSLTETDSPTSFCPPHAASNDSKTCAIVNKAWWVQMSVLCTRWLFKSLKTETLTSSANYSNDRVFPILTSSLLQNIKVLKSQTVLHLMWSKNPCRKSISYRPNYSARKIGVYILNTSNGTVNTSMARKGIPKVFLCISDLKNCPYLWQYISTGMELEAEKTEQF
jgi:hypothetical protein